MLRVRKERRETAFRAEDATSRCRAMRARSPRRSLPASLAAPLLASTGAPDELVPIRDLYWPSEQGLAQDVLGFADDRHCASRNRLLHEPFAASWLEQRLEVDKSTREGCLLDGRPSRLLAAASQLSSGMAR